MRTVIANLNGDTYYPVALLFQLPAIMLEWKYQCAWAYYNPDTLTLAGKVDPTRIIKL